MVTLVPTGPLFGEKLVMTGGETFAHTLPVKVAIARKQATENFTQVVL